MKNRRNYYRILQVQPDAPLEIIRASYRVSMLKMKQHPDLGGVSENAALLNEAYEVLSDPKRRSAYDRELNLAALRKDRTQESQERPRRSYCRFCRNPITKEPELGERCSTCESPLVSALPAEVTGAGRRSISRFRRDEKLRYYTGWPQRGREGRLVDLSPKGMRFICADNPPSGAVLKITSPIVDAVASVTNVQCETHLKGMEYSVGVVFLTVIFDHTRGTFVSTDA